MNYWEWRPIQPFFHKGMEIRWGERNSIPKNFYSKPFKDEFSLSAEGKKLREFYKSLNVENLWLSGQHVNWETGVQDNPEAEKGNHTHCSAFVAAACKRMNIYILRPPEHGQILLSNAQADWLDSEKGRSEGWQVIMGNNLYENVQNMANGGKVVLAVFKNPDPSKPGHIALIMPTKFPKEEIIESGPKLIMAGEKNWNQVNLKTGFKYHVHHWPENEIKFYYNNKMANY